MNLFIKALIESFKFSLEYRNLLSMGADEFTFNVNISESIYSDWFIDSLEVTVNKKMELINLVAYVDAGFLKYGGIDSKISELDIDSIVVISDKEDILHNISVSLEYLCLLEMRVPVDNVLIKYDSMILLKNDYELNFIDTILKDNSGLKYSLLLDFFYGIDKSDLILMKLKELFSSANVEYLSFFLEYDFYGEFNSYLKSTVEKLRLLGYNNIKNKGLVFSKKTIERNYYNYVDGIDDLNLELFIYLNDLKNNGFGIFLED